VGERLIRAYLDLMSKQGVAAIKLSVLDSNRAARHLYERLGWKAVATTTLKRGPTSHYYVFYFDRPPAPG